MGVRIEAEDYVIIAGRYAPQTEFITEIHVADETMDKDLVQIMHLITGPNFTGLPNRGMGKGLRQYGYELRTAGWDVVLAQRSPSGWVIYSMISDSKDVPRDHRLMDLVRELCVEWSNAVHDGKLEWAER